MNEEKFMKQYILIVYTKSKYTGFIRRYVEFFDYEDDLVCWLDKKYNKVIKYYIYKETNMQEIIKEVKH